MKKIIIISVAIIGFIVFFVVSKNTQRNNESQVENSNVTNMSFCYYKKTIADNGGQDRSWLKIEDTSQEVGFNTISGEFYNLPFAKDSKFGQFAGEFYLDQKDTSFLKGDLFWEAQAEGTIVMEELSILFNPNEARVGFGEMKDRGDGVYVYVDKENIPYWQTLSIISCEDLNEEILVDKYVRANISSISSKEPVLGGSWYVISLDINTSDNTGLATYEDGHVEETMQFSYEVNGENVVISPL